MNKLQLMECESGVRIFIDGVELEQVIEYSISGDGSLFAELTVKIDCSHPKMCSKERMI